MFFLFQAKQHQSLSTCLSDSEKRMSGTSSNASHFNNPAWVIEQAKSSKEDGAGVNESMHENVSKPVDQEGFQPITLQSFK